MSAIETCHPTENDIPWITQSMETSLVSPFQKLSAKQLFEITPWSLICRSRNEIKAFAAFLDYPYNDHYSKVWYQSIQNVWEKSPYCGAKTIFLHFMICKSNVKVYLEEMLNVTFRTISSLEWCCILTDGVAITNSEIAEIFCQEKSMECEQFQFWSTNRNAYISNIGIRSKKSEDYLSLKNMFSQMYGNFKNDNLKKYTLDFLDYGEDKRSTYKYFTFDDDNTYIGVADDDIGEAVGFIYATIQRVDLDLMNYYFQLETVYGLRKKHPADKPENFFDIESSSDSEESIDEEDELRVLIESIINVIVFEHEIRECLNDILDEVCDPTKRSRHRRGSEKQTVDTKELMNSNDFSISNLHHLSLIKKHINYFETDTLIRLVNSADFDINNEVHMKLVLRLGKEIQNIEENRIKEILNSNLFDPSVESFAAISVYVMRHMPEQKLELFKKSQIGHELYEKLMYNKAIAKKNEIPKAKKPALAPKLSFKDTQIILHYTKNEDRIKHKELKAMTVERNIDVASLKHIHYRNMGFIAGLAVRGQYRIQGSFSFPKLKEPFGFEKGQDPETAQASEKEINLEVFEKYPLPFIEKAQRLIQEIPHYNGGTNCLYVEQFAIEKDHEHQSLYLIMSAFEYFPRVDYCMLLLPYGTHQVPYLRTYFHAVPARPFCAYEKELFVFHKATFNRSYEVRKYRECDFRGVKRLIQSSCLKDYLLKDLEQSLKCKENEIQVVILLSDKQVFGVAIVKELKEVEIIRRKYDVAERINMKYHKYKSQGQLLHCVIHPVFKYFSRMFLKEVMRFSQKSILYFKVYPTHLIPYNPSLWQSLCNVLEYFVPLKLTAKAAHKIKSYIVFNKKDANGNNDNKKYEDNYYCLCYTCTKLILKNNNVISSRIIIVGDSTAALGILESLIYRNDCKYTNITIISKSSIREEFILDERCYSFLPSDIDYTRTELHSLCLPAWVTIIRADVISVKRNLLRVRELSTDKHHCFTVGFDYLVICDDLQFQDLYSKKLINDANNVVSKKQRYPLLSGLRQERYVIAKNASNVFSVNNAYESAKLLNWLWRFLLAKVESRKQPKKKYKNLSEMERDKKDGRIVVFGNSLEAYTAIVVLLAEEFPLCKITFIKGKSDTDQSIFHSEFIEEAIDHLISESEIQMFNNAAIEYDMEAEEVFCLDVTTDEGTTRIDCSALLLFHEKNVNLNTFKTLHESLLAFSLPVCNSKNHPYLLINTNFQTNIRNIFAVGTITEMHTGTGIAIRLEDCAYNKREIGMIVGENVHKATINDLNLYKNTFPVLSKPEVTYAKLPNKYFYIFVTSPSSYFIPKNVPKESMYRIESLVLGNLNTGAYIIPAPMTEEETNLLAEDVDSKEQLAYQEFLQEIRDFAQEEREDSEAEVIIERTIPDEPDYFALTFDDNENVKTIECFTKIDLDVAILKYLHGIHISQIYKIVQKVQRETGVYFRLAEGWILPLDHVVFEDNDIKPRRRGYEGYWRPGYPKVIEDKLNGFLDSFVTFKEVKK